MRNSSSLIRVAWILAFLAGSILLATMAGWISGFPLWGTIVKALLLGAAIFIALWLLWKLLRIFLWRVGRRLTFSYFLMGILPIPMVTLFALLVLYLLSGYFLGHLYRDASSSLQQELEVGATARLRELQRSASKLPPRLAGHIYAYYKDGTRVGGSPKLPRRWPGWMSEASTAKERSNEREDLVSYVSIGDGPPTIAAAKQRGHWGVLAIFEGAVDIELAERSGVWVLLERASDREEHLVRINLRDKDYFFRKIQANPDDPSRQEFFGLEDEESQAQKRHWWRQPFIWWGELAPPLLRLSDGDEISPYVTANLNATPSTIYRHLLSASGEVDTAVWGGLIAVAGVLFSVYSVAIGMAFFMIFTLSRAVNQLSKATGSVRSGDFSVRIPVRRHDQIGELHESFNEMAAGLERSVATVAQKEILEKELQIARELQQRLLPRDIPSSDAVEFATLFEPSAAIGGDYFDILRIDDHRLIVVIADVSGHGLPTGLRMAMLKAALVILVEDGKSPIEIFDRLSWMVRAEQERRFFVTCTLAVVDFQNNTLSLTNAGHPPTYLLRHAEVIELALEGNPLGALGETFGQRQIGLEDGDVLVWLSDGLIEATNREGDPFGYERLQKALEGPAETAAGVNRRLIAAVESFSEGEVAEDDKTLVSMRYSIPELSEATANAE
jgi:HAMP domain-containing protein